MLMERFSASRAFADLVRICSASKFIPPSFNPRSHLGDYLAYSQPRMRFFARQMAELGYRVVVQPFKHTDVSMGFEGRAANCFAYPGWHVEPGSVLVIGHHDYCAGLGAEDNGTALATMLELARVFQGFPKLCFASFDLEEVKCVGSRYFVNRLSDSELSKFAYIVCLECLGSGKDLIINEQLSAVKSDPGLISAFAEAARRAGHEFVTHRFDHFYSDHVPFAERGVKTVMLGSLDLAAWNALSQKDLLEQILDAQKGKRRKDGSVAHTAFDIPESIKSGNLAKAGAAVQELVLMLT